MRILAIAILGLGLAGLGGSGCASESALNLPYGDGGFRDGSFGATGPAAVTPAGSCNPTYCPSSGVGKGCCITANGPCGVDLGMGCMASARDGG
jgi:hypothetical protein